MNYRMLSAEEWSRLDGLIPADKIPPPTLSAAAIAEDEAGTIQGVWLLQLQLHAEPLLIRDPKVNFKRLHAVLYEFAASLPCPAYFAFSETPKIERMLTLAGMTPMPYKIWRREVD